MREVEIDPDKFDGSRFAKRYGLDPVSFSVEPRAGKSWPRFPDLVPKPPVLDPPDTTQRDAILAIIAKREAGRSYTGADRDEVLDWLLGIRR